MKYSSLDLISKSILLRKRYGMHFYLDVLLAGRDCIREITLDDLQVVNTKRLPIDQFSAVTIPNDFVDYVSVNVMMGQQVQPLIPNNSINNLVNYDSSFNQIRYDQEDVNNTNNTPLLYYGVWNGWWNTTHFNSFGESTGRWFGSAGTTWNTFKIIPERNVIQLNESITSANFPDGIILIYISDGRNADAATHVPPYAESTIEAYILWQLKEHRRDISEGEKDRAKRAYLRERQILRARKNPLTIELLRKIIAKNQRQSIKS